MIHYQIYRSIKDVPQEWDALTVDDILLQSTYLQALENAAPSNIKCFYIGVFKGEALIGVALIQRVQLYLKDMFRDTRVSCVKTFLKDTVSKLLKGNILVVGNLTHTGQHGLYFDSESISNHEFYNAVFKGVSEIESTIKAETNKTIRLILAKDYFLDDAILDDTFFKRNKLHKATVQPNMIMNIREDWCENGDYISCMNKKYRRRYKRAKKKLNSIVCKEMNLETIKTSSKLLHDLYLNVSNNAKFNTFILPESHFYNYKLHLKDNFKVFGYYLKDELVGFFTLILNDKQLETYFLGYDSEHQYPNQLYLNMLYDMTKFGIEAGFESIVFARTAMEIKSSVGAKAKPMVMYLKHTNGVLNAILKQVFRFMNPKQDWEERHPFD
ncbi:GNAT family N-acetyltransferase [Hyunsoonleella flava]|uniref:GNAT family N-acetyltransferase n=1 Tax=Hyunsoonleella flava TaxID=2527939 RepID=A0A4Q9FF57_9FLAO|nr:GNAT family N-acetyltransferase [Hyunsoonleella flava]TBN04049.1 GNAT family N-acetyltransferase [Hyunsoonleella flava]